MTDYSIEKLNIDKLADKYIYFGHQSVGKNILDGIAESGINIQISEITEIGDKNTGFIHSYIGENTNPLSKLEDFSETIKSINGEIDISIIKFCYIDFNENTDIQSLLSNYMKVFDQLHDDYPGILFVHMTIPLVEQQNGIKAFVKRILKRPIYGSTENLVRQDFNALLRENYANIFDLAAIESTRPDGTRLEHMLKGRKYYSLYPGYTDDGGHLNETGRRIVAYELLKYLSEMDTK